MIKEKEFECPICIDIFELPIVLCCGHTFCKKCLEIHKENSNKCPICRNYISWGYPCFILKSLIEKYSLIINGKNPILQ